MSSSFSIVEMQQVGDSNPSGSNAVDSAGLNKHDSRSGMGVGRVGEHHHVPKQSRVSQGLFSSTSLASVASSRGERSQTERSSAFSGSSVRFQSNSSASSAGRLSTAAAQKRSFDEEDLELLRQQRFRQLKKRRKK